MAVISWTTDSFFKITTTVKQNHNKKFAVIDKTFLPLFYELSFGRPIQCACNAL
jgi:hypothetical protein